MRLKRHVPLLESTLKRVAARPLLSSQCNRRRYASASAAYPENIAILGGGISGLTSAYFVSKEFPRSKITIYESEKEAGGWIKSRRHDVPGGGEVLFEGGPRTLRPGASSMPTVQLIQELNLAQDLLVTKRDSPAAQNRYIYYPDRLNRMPNQNSGMFDAFQLLRSGILDGVYKAILEPTQRPRSHRMTDESIGSFISRRFDQRVAQNMISAIMHGIYAGDVWKLSARTLMPTFWELERSYGSVLGGYLKLNNEDPAKGFLSLYTASQWDAITAVQNEIKLDRPILDALKGASTFTFRNGLQQLVDGLQHKIQNNKQIDIKLETPVQSFKMVEGSSKQVEVVAGTDASQTTRNYDLVISTLRNKLLTDYVNVMTVSLFYKNPKLLPVSGFGYLIPQSIPFEQNPERALGVIFDSDAVAGQDSIEGTKLTVMLGGHWWDGWVDYPDSFEGAELAKSVVQRHLGIAEEPVVTQVNLNKDCIPQYNVGYADHLKHFATAIQDEFKGRLRLVGNQYNGVGVNDCIQAAWLLARGLRGNGWKNQSCGLDHALDERPAVKELIAAGSRMSKES